MYNTHTHTHTLNAILSPTRSSKCVSSGTCSHRTRAISWGRCKRIYGFPEENNQDTPKKKGQHSDKHMENTEDKTKKHEVSIGGGKQRIQEICSPGSFGNNNRSYGWSFFFFFFKGCIILHSMAALSVQECGMRPVDTGHLSTGTGVEKSNSRGQGKDTHQVLDLLVKLKMPTIDDCNPAVHHLDIVKPLFAGHYRGNSINHNIENRNKMLTH